MLSFSADELFHLQCKRQRPGTEDFHISPDCLPNPIIYPTDPEEPVTHPDSSEEEEKSYSKTESNTGE